MTTELFIYRSDEELAPTRGVLDIDGYKERLDACEEHTHCLGYRSGVYLQSGLLGDTG